MRNTYAIIVGIIDKTFVLLQRKDGVREVCATNKLHLEEEVLDINGLSAEEIGKLIPDDICVKDTTNDFDRFKQKLAKRIEDEILREKGLA
ncbi:hypothetical protein OCOL_000771 [Ordospora colligata]